MIIMFAGCGSLIRSFYALRMMELLFPAEVVGVEDSKTTGVGFIHKFVPLVEFLGAFLGENYEVVLHDVSEGDRSVLAIANSENISGRKVGAPLTDLALKFVVEREYEKRDWAMGYMTQAKDGSPLHSATYFIREDGGELAGLLCLNMHISDFVKARDTIDRLLGGFSCQSPQNGVGDISLTESFSSSVEDLTGQLILQIVQEKAVPPERMTTDEKIDLVRILNERGVFLLKGAVHVVAEHLSSSEPTIYRYLQKLS